MIVTGKAIGSRKPLFAEFSVPPPADSGDGGNATLRDVLDTVVRHEVEAFQQRQRHRQFLRVLTQREIQAGVEAGKIDSGGAELEPQTVDADDAVAVALQAFEDGLYLVVIDDEEQTSLDAPVFLQQDSRLTFIRLTMLAGG